MNAVFDPIVIACWMLVVIFSLTVHEAAHAFTANRLGDPTAYHGGYASLDPMPHIMRAPIGMIVAPLISIMMVGWPIGWASVPVDPQWMVRYPRFSATVSMAGPLSNLLLALLSAAALKVGVLAGFYEQLQFKPVLDTITAQEPGLAQLSAKLLSMFLLFNIVLTIFNLIPLPPLDGSAIPLFFLSESEAQRYFEFVYNQIYQIAGLMILWSFGPALLSPVFFKLFRVMIGAG